MSTPGPDISLIPWDAKSTTACVRCHYVLEKSQWRRIGPCPNCRSEEGSVYFQGAVALTTVQDDESYILRLLKSLDADEPPRIPGVYAVSLARRAAVDEDD